MEEKKPRFVRGGVKYWRKKDKSWQKFFSKISSFFVSAVSIVWSGCKWGVQKVKKIITHSFSRSQKNNTNTTVYTQKSRQNSFSRITGFLVLIVSAVWSVLRAGIQQTKKMVVKLFSRSTKNDSGGVEEFKLKSWQKLGIAVLSLCIVVGGIFALWYRVGLHQVGELSEKPFTMFSARVLKLPIAWINGDKIEYTVFLKQLHATKLFFDTDSSGSLTKLNDREMRDYVLARLMVGQLTNQVAHEYNVSLEESELEKILETQLIENFGSREKGEADILRRYGWNLEEFQKSIVFPTELEKKLVKTYLASIGYPEDKEVTRARAQSVLERIKNGESFEALAQEFGQDDSSKKGGNLGWFARGMLESQIEEKAFSLQKGEVAPELIETDSGFNIMRVDDTRTGIDSNTGRPREEISAHRIFFKIDKNDAKPFADYMNKRLLDSKVKVVEGIHNPLSDFFAQHSTSQAK